MRQTNVRGSLSLRGFRKLRTGAIVATGVILLGLGFLAPTVSASEQDGVWVARTVEEVKADIQNIDNLSHYTIKWGDTLSAISGATGLSVDSLVEINRIANRDLIFANNKLYFSEEAFLKDGNTEVKRQRVSIENSGSRQSYEVETKTDTVTGEQTTTVKQTTPVAVETPAVSAPKSETSVSVAPKAETREEVSNTPSLGATNQSVASNPSSEVPVPSVSAPKAEEPLAPASKVEEPARPAPKAEEPASSAPKVEQPKAEPEATKPATPAPKEEAPTKPTEPKAETPAPKAEEPTKPTEPKAETPAPKVDEPAESVEPKGTEPEAAKPTEPKAETPALKAEESVESVEPKGTEPEAAKPTEPKAETPAPKEEAPTKPTEPKGTEPEAAKPATPKAETPTPKENATEEAEGNPTAKENPTEGTGSEGATGTEVKPAPKESGTTEEGKEAKETEEVEGNPTAKEDAPKGTGSEGATGTVDSTPAPKESGDEGKEEKETEEAGTPGATGTEVKPAPNEAGTTAEAGTEVKPAEAKKTEEEKLLEETKQDSIRENIDEVVNIKLAEIEKIENSDEKIKLKEKLDELRKNAVDAIKNAKDEEEALELTEKHQNIINSLEISGEKYTKPNYDKDNLSNGRNDGTTIDNGSTVIGHGSGEAPSGVAQPEAGTDNSATTSSTQPASETSSTSTTSETSSAQPATETPQAQPASTTGGAGFRRAGEYRATARRVARSVNEPEGTINISYNYDGMPDIHGFFADPGENNTVTIPAGTNEEQAKELVKEKIQAKIKDLAARGYHVKNDIIFEQDTTVKNYNYVVTFTKEATGTTGFRIAPKVQVRAKKVVKRDLSNKTKHINVYYNLTALKDIAGALGELGDENVLTFSGETSKEELKRAVEEKTKAQIEKLKKQGFTVTSKTDLDQIAEGGDSYDYVVEFTKESKTQPVGTTGFRMAPAVQRRAKRSTEVKETVNVNIYFNLKTLPGIAGALDVDGETTIKLPKNASEKEVKEAIKEKIAKVESRGYKVIDAYFGAKTEKGYDYVVEFTK
ncbi:LysM peptidoglycan-binding domain-containing protein [Streptococcus sp.]